jgi:hypothetical protein
MHRVDDTFPLEQLPDAFNKSKQGHVVGKIAIKVA